MRSFEDVQELLAAEGADLGATAWRQITQEQVDSFADTTDDHQWIHVDTERAASGPYGGTIAHGMLTLSLVPVMIGETVSVNATYGLHYGFEKVRFTAPVPVGSRIRAHVTVLRTAPVEGGTKATFGVTVEVEGGDKPACVAEDTIVWLT
ncbi:MaoC family dehydratase [Petropleomorpha daqingensis]|uniref:Acyl dehydratase n=1 Tax=Petropleomorpha daqingensis TaxID=2026353 RepID=A0A853CQC2_9ACTN|nr:MaoC family dehydratase [Petropleomorpha daqingensis]NYJ08692.1 acyl dehydratase [Petropleomorpha daqingensis]